MFGTRFEIVHPSLTGVAIRYIEVFPVDQTLPTEMWRILSSTKGPSSVEGGLKDVGSSDAVVYDPEV